MKCENCNGLGLHEDTIKTCFICNGWGNVCDHCGEACEEGMCDCQDDDEPEG